MTKSLKALTGEQANGLIARQIGQLRRAQHLSFDALAARSEVSKGMLVAIEQGNANPSISTLCKLAAGLGVSLADLLSDDLGRASAVRIEAPEQAQELWQGARGGRATLLVGARGPDMLELWEWTLAPGEKFASKGHAAGTVELLAVTEGTLALEVDGVTHLVAAEHRAVANADRPHVYRCHGRKRTRFQMVVHEPAALMTQRSTLK